MLYLWPWSSLQPFYRPREPVQPSSRMRWLKGGSGAFGKEYLGESLGSPSSRHSYMPYVLTSTPYFQRTDLVGFSFSFLSLIMFWELPQKCWIYIIWLLLLSPPNTSLYLCHYLSNSRPLLYVGVCWDVCGVCVVLVWGLCDVCVCVVNMCLCVWHMCGSVYMCGVYMCAHMCI